MDDEIEQDEDEADEDEEEDEESEDLQEDQASGKLFHSYSFIHQSSCLLNEKPKEYLKVETEKFQLTLD